MSEELLVLSINLKFMLEKWEYGENTNSLLGVAPYDAKELIPIGMSEFDGGANLEFSYFYALPVPDKDLPILVAADDYGKGKNVQLSIYLKTEMELLKTPYSEPQGEVCDAITRLWDRKNENVYNKLIEIISNYNDN